MTESRVVALLLTDVVNSTQLLSALGDEAGTSQRARHFSVLRACLRRHDGVEVTTTGDGLLAVFSSALEMARCAADMQRSVRRESHRHPEEAARIRVALHVGEPHVEGGMYFGAPMVLLNRLCAAATPDQVLASAPLRQVLDAHRELRFEPVGRLVLKGIDEPTPAFSLGWSEPEPGDWPLPEAASLDQVARLRGRARQLRAVGEWAVRSASGRRTVGVLVGEPGIGKSRLAAELVHQQHREGALVLWGRCHGDQPTRYGPFLDALRGYFQWAWHEGVLADETGAMAAELCARWPVLEPAGTGMAEATPLRPTDRAALELRCFELVDELLAELGRSAPVLLVLDDLHWADAGSARLLAHLARSTRRSRLLVLTTVSNVELVADAPVRTTLCTLRRERRIEVLRLGGLSPTDTASLVAEVGGCRVGRSLAHDLCARTRGNPLFLEEAARQLGGSPRRTSAAGVPRLTGTVRATAARHLGAVPPTVSRTLAAAAPLGSEFELGALAQRLGQPRVEVLMRVELAIERGLVAMTAHRDRYRFTHPLVRELIRARTSSAVPPPAAGDPGPTPLAPRAGRPAAMSGGRAPARLGPTS